MAERRRGRPTAVGEALQSYLAKAGLTKRLAQAQVIPDWPVLVGPQIAAVSTRESVTPDGTLFVRASTSGWMTGLQLMAPPVMEAHERTRPSTQPQKTRPCSAPHRAV